jgi:hypothetical protein
LVGDAEGLNGRIVVVWGTVMRREKREPRSIKVERIELAGGGQKT